MMATPIHLLLADDDPDDCLIFKEALDELDILVTLQTVNDGQQLMKFLKQEVKFLPKLLFLDINMPLKNGIECLTEIKNDQNLKKIPVVMYSTSSDEALINSIYQNGALRYIIKPSSFLKIKEVIQQAISLVSFDNIEEPPEKDQFILT